MKSHKTLTAVLATLVCIAIAAAVVVPFAVTKTGAFADKETSRAKAGARAGEPNTIDPEALALVVMFQDAAIDALQRVPPSLRQYVERRLLEASTIQILRFTEIAVLLQVYGNLLQDKDIAFVLRDRKMRTPFSARIHLPTNFTPTGLRRLHQASEPWWSSEDYFQSSMPYSSNMQGAWSITPGNPGIVVAVVDTGVDYTHPDLAGIIWKNKGEIPGNKVDDDKNGFVDDDKGWNFGCSNNDPQDPFGHGTNVAGIIAAISNNRQWFAGAASVQIMPLRLNDCSPYGGTFWLTTVLDAFNYAAKMGAHIVQASVGPSGFDYGIPSYAPGTDQAWLTNAFNQAHLGLRQRGALVVAAAGNEGMSLDDAAAAGWAYPPCTSPADNVICVGATDTSTGSMTDFSNYGTTWVDLYAPGTSVCNDAPIWQEADATASYCWTGTSQATPITTGAAALVLSVLAPRNGGNLTALWPIIKASLLKSVAVAPAGALPSTSNGRVDALAAVNLAITNWYGAALVPSAVQPLVAKAGLGEDYFTNPTGQFATAAGLIPRDSSVRVNAFPVTSFKYSGAGVLVRYSGLLLMTQGGPSAARINWVNSKISMTVAGRALELQALAPGVYNTSFAVAKAGWYPFQILVADPSPTSRLDITWLQPGMTSASPLSIFYATTSLPDPTPFTTALNTSPGFLIAYNQLPTTASLAALLANKATVTTPFSKVATVPDLAFAASAALKGGLFPGMAGDTAVYGSATTFIAAPNTPTSYNFQVMCASCKLYVNGMLVIDAFEGLPKQSGCVTINPPTALSAATNPSPTALLTPLQLDFVSPSLSTPSQSSLALLYQTCIPATASLGGPLAPLASLAQNSLAFSNQNNNMGQVNGMQCNIWNAAALPDADAALPPNWMVRLPICPPANPGCSASFRLNLGTDILPGLSASSLASSRFSLRCWTYWSSPPPSKLTLLPPGTAYYAGRQITSPNPSIPLIPPPVPVNPTTTSPLFVLEWANLPSTAQLAVLAGATPISLSTPSMTLPVLPTIPSQPVRGLYSTAYTPTTSSPEVLSLIPTSFQKFPTLSSFAATTLGLNTAVTHPKSTTSGVRYSQSRGYLQITRSGTYKLQYAEPANQGNLVLMGGLVLVNAQPFTSRLAANKGTAITYSQQLYLVPGFYTVQYITKVSGVLSHLYNMSLVVPSPAVGPAGPNIYFQSQVGY